MLRRSILVLFVLAALSLGCHPLAAASEPQAFAETWQALAPPGGGVVFAFAASPAFAADRTLFAATPTGIHRSPDAGQSWLHVNAAPLTHVRRLATSPAYPVDHTLFLLIGTNTPPGRQVLRSGDSGATWSPVLEAAGLADLAVSPAFAVDGTVFVAGAPFAEVQVYRSIDRGHTFQPAPGQPKDLEAGNIALSPAYATDHTLFVAGYGPLQRSVDAGDSWQKLGAAGPNYSLAVSPAYATDRTVWAVYREIEASAMQPEAGVIRSTDGGNTWSNVSAGLYGDYNMNYRSLAAGPAGTVYLALTGPQWDLRFPPAVYRSDTNGQRWAPQPLLPGGAAPEQIVAAGPLPDLFVLAGGALYRHASTCYQALADGGFETDPDLLPYITSIPRAWEIPATAHPAGYTNSVKQAGAWAMRSGIPLGGTNVLSYSDFRQRLSIPADALSAVLKFGRYPVQGDAVAANAAAPPENVWFPAGPDAGPWSAGPWSEDPQIADYQYVLARFDDGYQILRSWRDNGGWRTTEVDLLSLKGRSFGLQFGVYNNGADGVSAMYVDEATVTICRPAPAAAVGKVRLPLILSSPPAITRLVVNGVPATRLITDRHTPDRYALSTVGLHRQAGGGDWVLVHYGALAGQLVFSPADSNRLWAGSPPACLAGGPPQPMTASNDGGLTWRELPAGQGIQPIIAHPTDPLRVYGLGCAGVYLTRDGGETWQHQDAELWRLYYVSDIAPVDPDWTTVYAAGVSEGGGGMVAKSMDGGATWQRVTPAEEDIWWISGVWVDPVKESRVYFTGPQGVWRSENGGGAWRLLTEGLEDVLWAPDHAEYGLLQLRTRDDDPGHLYVGSVAGLYESHNYGATWYKRSGYPWDDVAVDALRVEGRGLWLTTAAGVYYLAAGG